jgi:hypothetical protein
VRICRRFSKPKKPLMTAEKPGFEGDSERLRVRRR